jgi:transposase
MDFNIFLNRFGFDSSSFVNRDLTPIQEGENLIYEVEEEYKERICPFCNHEFLNIHDYKWIKVKLNTTIGLKEELRIKRIRYKCRSCNKTHTFKLEGIERNKTISNFTLNAIRKEFFEIQSFSTIAKRYDISLNQVINIFDDYTKVMLRRPLPEYMCIDEKHFETDPDGKYCVVISDFFTGEVIDVLENRKMPYLERYFSSIPFGERSRVKVFITDMYDGYYAIKNRFFPKAIFVIDLFHVIKNLTEAINRIRIRTYNQNMLEDTLERNFMKNNWRCFLMDKNKIFFKIYHSKKYELHIPYGDIILECVKKNLVFWDGYNVLQELLHYDKYETYGEADKFMDRIIEKLNLTEDELLKKVASTYTKWKVGIIHGLARNQTGRRFSNAVAENNNSHIQRVINVAYGYKNFDRFRARVMLLLTYKK